jgi:hypothetical protein
MNINWKKIPGKIGLWFIELVTVFIGVYLAFLLNGHRIQQNHEHKRQQIYVTLYRYFSELHFKKPIEYFENRYVTHFLKPYKKGKMPRLVKPTRFLILTINDHTWNSMLQAGGFDLLNIKFIQQVNIFFNIVQKEKAMTNHFNQMTDEYLIPNYNAPLAEFYNTKTKKLKPIYEWYVNYIEYTQDRNKLEAREAHRILKTLKQKMNKKQLQKIKKST